MKKYEIVKEYLLEHIKNGDYKLECAITPERELASILGVNRVTVRKAIEDLMYEGILTRKKGSGTFLAQYKASKPAMSLGENEEGMRTIKILGCKQQQEGNYACKTLSLKEGTKYWRLRRVKMINEVPYAYEDILFAPQFFKVVDKSFYMLGLEDMAKKSGVKKILTYEEVEALMCLQSSSNILRIPAGGPLLQIKSNFERAEDGELIMSCRSYHPNFSYKYKGEKHKI